MLNMLYLDFYSTPTTIKHLKLHFSHGCLVYIVFPAQLICVLSDCKGIVQSLHVKAPARLALTPVSNNL